MLAPLTAFLALLSLIPLALAQGAGSVDGNATPIPTARVTPYTTIATTTLSPSATQDALVLTISGGNTTTVDLSVTGTPVYIVVSGSTTVAVPTRSELPAISRGAAVGVKDMGQSWAAVIFGAVAMALGMM